MRVARANNVIAANIVVLAGQKSSDKSRRDAFSPQHHRHRRSKIFAVAGAFLQQEICQRVFVRRHIDVQRVSVSGAQKTFDVRSRVIRIVGPRGDLIGQRFTRGSIFGNCK